MNATQARLFGMLCDKADAQLFSWAGSKQRREEQVWQTSQLQGRMEEASSRAAAMFSLGDTDAFRASLADIRQAVRETGHLRGWDATYTDQKALDAVGEALMPVGRTLIADGNLNDARAFLEEHAPALGANRLRALQNAIKSEQRRRDAEAEANRNKENYEREAYAVS